jgi:hypothetical protein
LAALNLDRGTPIKFNGRKRGYRNYEL